MRTRRRSALLLAISAALLATGVASGQGTPGGGEPGSPVAAGGPGSPSAAGEARPRASAACVVRAELRGVINAGSASYLESALAAAEERGCALLVPLDTPGGMLEETRRLVSAFLEARVPVVVHVAPAAARAGSAGVLVTMAAHVAVMAPGSNLGAAHPVTLPGGGDADGADEMARKVENDVAALARSIAAQRDRNAEWAEAAVRESAAATAEEARELGVVDLVIGSEVAVLDGVDGRTVRLAGGEEVVLATAGAEITDHAMTVQQWTLTKLGEPTLAYALLMLGMLALVLELFQPGLGVAGVVGGLLVLLGAIGLHLLPVDVGAVILLVAALGLFVAEMYVTSFGLLALGGVACLLVGAALLVDTSDPELLADASVRVSWGVALPLALVLGVAAIVLGSHVARAQRRRSTTGAEGLLGELGEAMSEVDRGGGSVWLHGERWQAESDEPLPASTKVRVRDVRGLVLRVARADEPQGGVS